MKTSKLSLSLLVLMIALAIGISALGGKKPAPPTSDVSVNAAIEGVPDLSGDCGGIEGIDEDLEGIDGGICSDGHGDYINGEDGGGGIIAGNILYNFGPIWVDFGSAISRAEGENLPFSGPYMAAMRSSPEPTDMKPARDGLCSDPVRLGPIQDLLRGQCQ